MKQKFFALADWRKVVLPNSQWNYSTISPVEVIRGPFFVYTWAGIGSMVSGASVPWGTVVGCRIDPRDPKPLNLNNWHLNSSGTQSLLIIQDINDKRQIAEHWAKGMPSIFKNAPSSIRNLILTKQKARL